MTETLNIETFGLLSGLTNLMPSGSTISNALGNIKPAAFSMPSISGTSLFKSSASAVPASAIPIPTTAVAAGAAGTATTAAGTAVKNAPTSALDDVAKHGSDTPHITKADDVAKHGDDAADATKKAEKASPEDTKKLDDAAKDAEKDVGKETKESILTKKNAVLAAGAAGVAVYAGVAADNYFKKNGKKYNIISIEDASTDSIIKTKITIQAGDRFSNHDKVIIQDTNCVPIIDPSNNQFNIEQIITPDEFIIITPNKITTKGTTGTIVLQTTYDSQLAGLVKNGLEDLGSSVGEGLGGGLTEFLKGMGVSSDKIWLVATVIGVLFLLGILYALYRMFFSK